MKHILSQIRHNLLRSCS